MTFVTHDRSKHIYTDGSSIICNPYEITVVNHLAIVIIRVALIIDYVAKM